ncbi:hypothetical protein [Bacillus pumilus]|nr:hypothetical protein [Bacillus pumilus]
MQKYTIEKNGKLKNSSNYSSAVHFIHYLALLIVITPKVVTE